MVITHSACKLKSDPNEIPNHLKQVMQTFLRQERAPDSAKVKFEVLDVMYFEQPKFYNCEFKVRMNIDGKDTIGIMTGTITKDFTTVHRTY
jgi:hypothetical protein